MIWPVLILAAIALVLIALGALSVWAKVLLISLKIMLTLFIAAVMFIVIQIVWQRYSRRKS